MKKLYLLLILLTLIPTTLILILNTSPPTHATQTTFPLSPHLNQSTLPPLPDDIFVARVYYQNKDDISLLQSYDLFEYNNLKESYVLVALNKHQYQEIVALGRFYLTLDPIATQNIIPAHTNNPQNIAGIPGYACYRTVEETFTTAQNLATNYPNLASWLDIGDSWDKTQALGGYDIMVLKLTNNNIPGPKPKLFISAAIHAREYTPAELATRYAEYLVYNYNIDADATWLLDYHEIHLLLQANPDGRKHAETGTFWRKNVNNNFCSDTDFRGIDLNRNYSFEWDCCNGHGANECDVTYNGIAPASEPEVQAIQTYLTAEFPDQRLPDMNAAAPLTATGVFLDLHSYSNFILFPWSSSNSAAPNNDQLQTFARKLGYFNNYTPHQSSDFYIADGASMDFGYGELGIPSFVFEIGNVFYEACSTFDNTILPDNLPALIYAAKVARTPYLTPSGPDTLGLTATPHNIEANTTTILTATITDNNYNGGNGNEPTQNIAAAEYYINTPPWDTTNSPTPIPFLPLDGAFDNSTEIVTATLDTTSLPLGRHTIFVRGQDTDGNWGAISAIFIYVQPTGPHINLTPTTITTNQEPATITTHTITIDNTGSAPLTWNLSEDTDADCLSPADLPWLTTTATSGTLPAAQSTPLTLNIDTSSLTDGNYTAHLCFNNDDIDTADQLQIIPINLQVQSITCTIYPSTDIGGTISGDATLISASPVISTGTIVDLNLRDVTGTHPRTMQDVEFFLDGPSLFIRLSLRDTGCSNIADFNFDFDDDGVPTDCDINDNTVYSPYSTLRSYNGEDAAGIWYLHVTDATGPRDGQLTGWSLEVCTLDPVCTAPPAITDLTVTANLSDTILTWTPTTADAYELWWDTTPWFDTTADCTTAPNCDLVIGTNTYTHTNHAATPALYTYYLKSQAACGATAPNSNHTAAFTYPLTLP
ncbi:MAG TPA: M14 family zinc carboxypeptidase [Anaerolineae bacterium]|nr:M14 family zinc carboxypeptidase [Anaerolineae bacterium]